TARGGSCLGIDSDRSCLGPELLQFHFFASFLDKDRIGKGLALPLSGQCEKQSFLLPVHRRAGLVPGVHWTTLDRPKDLPLTPLETRNRLPAVPHPAGEDQDRLRQCSARGRQ